MPAPFVFDRTFDFDVPVAQFWDALTRTDDYVDWWPWLTGFDLPELAIGNVASMVIKAPLPYTLDVDVELVAVDPGRCIEGIVSGDVSGPARLHVTGAGGTTQARLSWELAVASTLLTGLARVARPLLVWGHDRVVGVGLRQFTAAALSDGRSVRVSRATQGAGPPRPVARRSAARSGPSTPPGQRPG